MPSDGGPAYPSKETRTVRHSLGNYETVEDVHKGLSLRDYFASMAPAMPLELRDLLYEHAGVDDPDRTHGEKCLAVLAAFAQWSYIHADAMLEARNGG